MRLLDSSASVVTNGNGQSIDRSNASAVAIGKSLLHIGDEQAVMFTEDED